MTGGYFDTAAEGIASTTVVTNRKPHCATLTYNGNSVMFYLYGASVGSIVAAAPITQATSYYRVGNGTPANNGWPCSTCSTKTVTFGLVSSNIEKVAFFKGTAFPSSQIVTLVSDFDITSAPPPTLIANLPGATCVTLAGWKKNPFSFDYYVK
jgi:hypothetical protein